MPVVYRRFSASDRVLHVLLMMSFLGLSMTGLPLLFHDSWWASILSRAVGGAQAAGWLHRASALLLISVFIAHLIPLVGRLLRGDLSVVWGPTSLVPQPRDFVELYQHMRWFVGLGSPPRFGRYTYWEKFDYWAVFWGMVIIGLSGLMLWFPTAFARLLPGWTFNVALLVHGEEALLAVVFIFTVHFFNTHLRPEKFPMDPVIFTGRVTEEELLKERPAEYDWLVSSGARDAQRAGPAPAWVVLLGRGIAGVVLSVGFAIMVLTVLTLIS